MRICILRYPFLSNTVIAVVMIHSISLRTSAQATEDLEKVKTALKLFLPPQGNEGIQDTSDHIHETAITGYYGNPITVIEAQLTKKKDCLHILDFIKRHLEPGDIFRLVDELPRRVDDECNLYIRFDKQDAYLGRLTITTASDAILIRIKLQAYPAKQQKAQQVAHELLTLEDRSWAKSSGQASMI